MKEIYLAGVCFWGLQRFFDQFEGVISTEVGYANGPEYTDQHAPSYEEVCRSSGHAETVKVTYDENLLSLPELVRYFFMVIDPVSVNRQGNDCGIQYRTGIYFTEMAQLLEIRPVYDAEQEKAGQPLAVELQPIKNFYSAEEYHQKYLEKNPDGYCHIPDKYYHMEKTEISIDKFDDNVCFNYELSDAWFRPVSSITILTGSENIVTFEVFGEEPVYYRPVQVPAGSLKISDQTIKQILEALQDRRLADLGEMEHVSVLDGYSNVFYINNGIQKVNVHGDNMFCCAGDYQQYPNANILIDILENVASVLVPLGVDRRCFLLLPDDEE